MPKNTKPSTKKSDKYDYVLDWIQESIEARRAQNKLVERAVMAYQGIPSKNSYVNRIREYAKEVYSDDASRAKAIQEMCSSIQSKRNYTVHNAIETLVSMSMGGVGQYEFGAYDPDFNADSKIIDRLSSAAKHFYDTEKMDAIVPQFIRNAPLRGASYLHIKHKKDKKVVTILTSDQMLTDPKRFKINRPRFIGFSQRESFKAVKDKVIKNGKGYMLKTINEAKIYVDSIVNELNGVNERNGAASLLHDELRKDIDTFYTPILTDIGSKRKTEPEYMYAGDEIEVSYIYDLQNDMYFEVINRRYIIVAKQNDLFRNVEYSYLDSKGKQQKKKKKVSIEHPFIELPYIKTDWDKYPITPLFYLLDDFDELCAMETILDHTLSIMAPITFVAQSSDAEKMGKMASISGETIEGVPATAAVFNKSHDVTPIVTAITRTEEKIKRVMKAVDPFELQAMIGDRASAKEVASASGQVAQGINPFLANIETAMAELGDKFMKMEVIYGKDTYSFTHNGKTAELEAGDMAHNFEIRAKMMTSIKLEQAQNARAAIELIGLLGANEAINKQQFLGTLIPISLNSVVTKSQAENMIIEEYRPMPEEVIARIKKQAEEDAKKNDIDKLDLSGYSEDEIDAMLVDMAQGEEGMIGMPMDGAGMQIPPAEGGMVDQYGMPVGNEELPVDPAMIDPGVQEGVLPNQVPLTPETGGEYANDPMARGGF